MQWHTNLRLPSAAATSNQLWRLGVDPEGCIASLEPLAAGSAGAGENWGGDWLSPAGVDLQINGGLGLPFPELVPGQLPLLIELLELLWRDGVEAICPTFVTCGVAPLRLLCAIQHKPQRRMRRPCKAFCKPV